MYLQIQYERNSAIQESFIKLKNIEEVLFHARAEELPFELARDRLLNTLRVTMFQKHQAPSYTRGVLLQKERDAKLYYYKHKAYLEFSNPYNHLTTIFQYQDTRFSSNKMRLFVLFINTVILLFFLYVIKKIWPLKKLRQQIRNFAQGEQLSLQTIQAKDEISEVSNEFTTAAFKIKHLQESRNLFLRNIMHELKTPIAKGKLISELTDDTKNQKRLHDIFSRFEFLLGEFAKVERITSSEFVLETHEFRLVDALDNALDLLMLSHNDVTIDLQEDTTKMIDYELFSIAIKNLIDNALKYGPTPPTILIKTTRLSVISQGAKIDNSFMENVFNRTFEDSSNGLGLGIYITKSIIQKHGFTFKYQHINNNNVFSIVF